MYKKKKTHSNRGMNFENEINKTNNFYLKTSIANIHKKPTPIKILKVNKANGYIEKAVFETPSTTDYNGIYNGCYIDFEAKECRSKTSFPLSNIHNHQLLHLLDVHKKGGISFLLINFPLLNVTYLYMISDLNIFIKINKRKSIPISEFNENGYIINFTLNPSIDYLKVIDKII